MKAFKPCVLMLAAAGALQISTNATLAAPQDNIIQQQQQILQQKEHEQASKRAEKDLQYRVSQSMTKTQQQGSSLEVFYCRKKKKAL